MKIGVHVREVEAPAETAPMFRQEPQPPNVEMQTKAGNALALSARLDQQMQRMKFFADRGKPVSENSIALLHQSKIGELATISVVNDAELLLEYAGTDGMRASGKFNLIPMNKLEELNSLMTHPIIHGLKRPQQKSFPNLNGLYMILRACGLLSIKGSQPKARLDFSEKISRHWYQLNATEKYFQLLNGWLDEATMQITGSKGRNHREIVGDLVHLVDQIADQTEFPRERYGPFYSIDSAMNAVLMEMFGWLEIDFFPPDSGKGPQISSLRWTPFGEAMMEVINGHWLTRSILGTSRPEPNKTTWLAFQQYFPELGNRLPEDEETLGNGELIWKISLAKSWRRIQCSADLTLDEFAMVILDAFLFDDDHLYRFCCRDRRGRLRNYECAAVYADEEFLSDATLSELPLNPGDSMTFFYDFGDNWKFNILLESQDSAMDASSKPKIIAQGGKAPDQYRGCEEW